MEPKPLFIALRAAYFEQFARGTKQVEWRRYGPRYNDRTLKRGRPVILSKGYGGERLRGRILGWQTAQMSDVPGALALWPDAPPDQVLVGIKIKLLDRPPRPR